MDDLRTPPNRLFYRPFDTLMSQPQQPQQPVVSTLLQQLVLSVARDFFFCRNFAVENTSFFTNYFSVEKNNSPVA